MNAYQTDQIDKLRQRDPQELEALFAHVNPYLKNILKGYRIPGPAKQDLIQSAWATFLDTLDRFQGRSQIKVFLAGILLNKLRESRRTESRFQFEQDTQTYMDSAFTPMGWWKQESPSPEQILKSKQIIASIEVGMQELSKAQRSAFILREVDELETEEICKILDVSVSHLGVLVFRAKEKLRKKLDQI